MYLYKRYIVSFFRYPLQDNDEKKNGISVLLNLSFVEFCKYIVIITIT